MGGGTGGSRMNWWGFAFIGMCVLVFILLLVVIWLDEREIERQEKMIVGVIREMAASQDVVRLDDYRERGRK
jgi:autotransporter translocation and assembly factor TamB